MKEAKSISAGQALRSAQGDGDGSVILSEAKVLWAAAEDKGRYKPGSASGGFWTSVFDGGSRLSERELAHLWEGQRFPPSALTTRDGRLLGVVYRGRSVGGPGPDFRDAVIAAPWGLLQGDVELHVRASDFRRHGHGRDPAYDGLALHVVFWDDEGSDTVLASGRWVPVTALAPWAEGRAQGDIRQWLQRPALWQEPCFSALERQGGDAVTAALDGLGDRRFREKAEAMRRLLEREPADELVWRGLLEALGYGGDRQAFRALALRLPWRRISERLCRLPAGQRLHEARHLLLEAAGPPAGGRARRGRPGNEGWRRLEGAARLAVRFCQGGLASRLEVIVVEAAEQGVSSLLAALSAADGQQALSTGRQAFIGRSRALEMAINVVLPYAAACGDAALAGLAEALYGRLPRPAAYGVVRHLDRAVGGAIRVDARRQQGMLYLLRRYCTQGGCGRCPLS